MKYFKVSIFLIILLLSGQSFTQNIEFTNEYKDAYNTIIKLDFEGGKEIIDRERAIHASNYYYVILESYIDFLSTIVGENEKVFKNFKSQKKARLQRIQRINKNSPYYLYAQAHIILQTAFARFKFEEYLSAGFELRKAYHLLKRNQEKFPEFLPNQIDYGLMHAMVGAIPNKYKWLAKLANMEGSIQTGYDEINAVLQYAKSNEELAYLINESVFFLTFIELNMTSDQKNAPQLLADIETLPNDNQMLVFAKVRLMNSLGRTDAVIELLDEFSVDSSYFKLDYLTYLHGLSKLNRLDKDADVYLKKYLKEFYGFTYKKSALQKLAWHALLNDDKDSYFEYLSKIEYVGSSLVDGDKQATREAKLKLLPHTDLLKARLQFDGAYYDQALDLLVNLDQNSLRNITDSTEYIYRKGRTLDKLGRYAEALKTYYSAYILGSKLPDYFAGNALLNIAVIYENKGEFDKAQDFYQRCVDLDFEVYKNSIEGKAKSGLDRIKTKKESE